MKLPVFKRALVVGIKYRKPLEKVAAALAAPADGLLLVREPTNPHDRCAVMVFHEDAHIGYVERAVAGPLSAYMDKGYFYTATVVKNRPSAIVVNIKPIEPPKKTTEVDQHVTA